MGVQRLDRRPVERPWGRRSLPGCFAGCVNGAPVGEIWFENGERDPLLVKYLFTSERLSIQVHPDDRAARARGHPHGKDEAWLVLDAEPGAAIGIGLTREMGAEELRAAALDGSLEALVDWRPVKAGDAFYAPAGTVHAIGGGLSLIEIQQNIDVTYRLYDYGRPRELHLDDAVAVAKGGPFDGGGAAGAAARGRTLLASGGAFTVERWRGEGTLTVAGTPLLLVPVGGRARVGNDALEAGSVWRVDGAARIEAGAGADLLAAYPGPPAPEAITASS